jgi:hypothetical protein
METIGDLKELISVQESEIERLNKIIRDYKRDGFLTGNEANKVKLDNLTLFSNFNDLERKFQKFEKWYGSYYYNYTQSLNKMMTGDPMIPDPNK